MTINCLVCLRRWRGLRKLRATENALTMGRGEGSKTTFLSSFEAFTTDAHVSKQLTGGFCKSAKQVSSRVRLQSLKAAVWFPLMVKCLDLSHRTPVQWLLAVSFSNVNQGRATLLLFHHDVRVRGAFRTLPSEPYPPLMWMKRGS